MPSNYLKPTHIIIHHSFTSDQQTVDWFSIEKYHIEVKKFQSIGYHFGIEAFGPSGKLVTLFGRPLWSPGAHTIGMNNTSVGICVVGNFDIQTPTDDHYNVCAELCAWLCHMYSIPVFRIRPHSEYAPKTCPGLLFSMDTLRDKTSYILSSRWS